MSSGCSSDSTVKRTDGHSPTPTASRRAPGGRARCVFASPLYISARLFLSLAVQLPLFISCPFASLAHSFLRSAACCLSHSLGGLLVFSSRAPSFVVLLLSLFLLSLLFAPCSALLLSRFPSASLSPATSPFSELALSLLPLFVFLSLSHAVLSSLRFAVLLFLSLAVLLLLYSLLVSSSRAVLWPPRCPALGSMISGYSKKHSAPRSRIPLVFCLLLCPLADIGHDSTVIQASTMQPVSCRDFGTGQHALHNARGARCGTLNTTVASLQSTLCAADAYVGPDFVQLSHRCCLSKDHHRRQHYSVLFRVL